MLSVSVPELSDRTGNPSFPVGVLTHLAPWPRLRRDAHAVFI